PSYGHRWSGTWRRSRHLHRVQPSRQLGAQLPGHGAGGRLRQLPTPIEQPANLGMMISRWLTTRKPPWLESVSAISHIAWVLYSSLSCMRNPTLLPRIVAHQEGEGGKGVRGRMSITAIYNCYLKAIETISHCYQASRDHRQWCIKTTRLSYLQHFLGFSSSPPFVIM
ncbi:hypothetical protein B0I35DRAFT_439912, partial [Stachybotrys elegans]